MFRIEILAKRSPAELASSLNERLRVLEEGDGAEIVDVKYAANESDYTAMIMYRVPTRRRDSGSV